MDVIIVGRGGGSIEELWAFNEEIVARAIFASKVPVISAVGHETDFTIADFVADVRAATPTAAAELAVPDSREIRNFWDTAQKRLVTITSGRLEENKRYLAKLASARVLVRPLERVDQARQTLDNLTTGLDVRMNYYLKALRPAGVNEGEACRVESQAVLNRGFSICYDSKGNIITDSGCLQPATVFCCACGKAGPRLLLHIHIRRNNEK